VVCERPSLIQECMMCSKECKTYNRRVTPIKEVSNASINSVASNGVTGSSDSTNWPKMNSEDVSRN
jgi:hypothetical protein